MEKLAFALYQYALLGVFAVAVYGLGQPLSGWMARSFGLSPFVAVPLKLASGIGSAIIALFVAGILGHLNLTVIAILILIGLALAIAPMVARLPRLGKGDSPVAGLRRMGGDARWWIAIAGTAGLSLLIRPLQPPHAWDELMYHLPYARFWAEQGALTVNEWLRYPLSAYNMNLLYAASMTLGNDVLPHLLHAFAAALTAVLAFGIGQRYLDWRVGLLAVIGLLVATRWGWENAYVDLGAMLFWSSAFAALALRYEHGDRRFSYLAAFLAGIAVGIKYQALFYLPVFTVLALVVERRPGVVAKSALILAATGGFWYLRNFLVSGDPVHPIGGPLFGFWLWNMDDLLGQYRDLDSARSWPPEWFLFPAIGTLLLWRSLTPIQRGLVLSSAAAVIVWYAVSGYMRYLIAVYPMLILLSAYFLVALLQRSGALARALSLFRKLDPRLRRVFPPLLLVAVAANVSDDAAKYWGRVAPNEESRAAYLSQRFAGYDLLRSAGDKDHGVLYQFGFEGELYHLGRSVRGDWFGPGRYVDVMSRRNDGAALAQHLEELGADSLLLNLERYNAAELPREAALSDYFELVARSDKAALYRLKMER